MPAIRDAFEHLTALQSATDRDDIIDALQRAGVAYGLPALVLARFAQDGGERIEVVASRDAEQVTAALAGLHASEALFSTLQAAQSLWRWGETLAAAPASVKAAAADGLAVPVRLPEGARGFVVLIGKTGDLSDTDELSLLALVQAAVAQLAHLAPEASVAAMLTPREREVLRWTAAGKTADASASILGISVRTVEYHLLNAARKLNTANRTHTVVEALRSRQISL